MLELLFFSNMACPDADALILKIQKQKHLESEVRIELVDTVKDYVPECFDVWGAND